MKTKLFCNECEKTYETAPENIELVQKFHPEAMQFEINRHVYTGGCFFKTLTRLKYKQDKEISDDTNNCAMDA